jgi:hypothetical protein
MKTHERYDPLSILLMAFGVRTCGDVTDEHGQMTAEFDRVRKWLILSQFHAHNFDSALPKI